MKEEQKNFIVFAVLAALIMIVSPMLMQWFFPQQQPPATVAVQQGEVKQAPRPDADPTADSPRANRDRALVLKETPRVAIETPELRGSINLKGARIDDLLLTRYDETVSRNSPPIRLLSPSGAEGAYFADFSWQGSGVTVPGPETLWTPSAETLTPERPVVLTATNGAGQAFRIEIAVDDKYMFTIRQSVANFGSAAVAVTPYARIGRATKSTDIDQWAAHVGPMAVYNGAADYIDYSAVDSAPKSFTTTGGWVGYSDHYWLTALIPDQRQSVTIQHRASPDKRYAADMRPAQAVSVSPGREVVYTSRFFAGAKEVKQLDAYQDDLGIVHLGRAIDWGWFEVLEKPIFYYLDMLYWLIGNFGVAILCLTITIRALLFPIAHRQFKSMAAMRVVQPKMKALQERYKDDKEKLQREMMKLYKDEKVNPLAGCLPIFLQIPIMFALYKVLLVTIEMRHAPFALWIRDLSAPDPANLVNLAALAGLPLPHFLALGVVPLLLGVSMYFQIKLSPQPMDDMQKQIFSIMPWVLMFLMAPYAVGLQIYWIASNCITILQQWWLYRQNPALKEPIAKPAT